MAKSALHKTKQITLYKRFAAGLLLFFAAFGLYAQNSSLEQSVFSPFVSQLTAEIRNNLVRLSWIDSRDVRGPVYIFRSLRPFDSASLQGIRPITIPYGTEYYVDETEGDAVFYYFVAASDINGQRYDIFIPYTNAISAGSSIRRTDTKAPVSGQQPQDAQTTQTSNISGLTAYADGERVVIAFTVSGNMKNVILYRTTQPVRRIQDLLRAVIVRSSRSSPVIDYPDPGFSYYYALLFEDDISRGTVDIRPGQNATIYPVEIAGAASLIPPEIRSIPLPSMSVINTATEGAYAQQPNPIPAETPKAEESRPAAPPQKRPRVFARDLEISAGGEESVLQTIVQGPIARREWQTAREQLIKYLSLPRSAATEARARFYLGQSYYFTGQNREALTEFMFVRDSYPNEAAEWIEAALGR